MRISSFIILAIGFLLLANNGYDELRQITRAPRYHGSGGELVFKQTNPEQFRNAMTTHWSMAIIISLVGVVWMVVNQRMERTDPMAADTDEKIDEELRQDEADEKMMKGKENGHGSSS